MSSSSALTLYICLQYMSAIWVHDDEQKQAAKHMVQDLEQRYGKTLTTKIQPAQHWTAAEEYHQKVCTLLQHLFCPSSPLSAHTDTCLQSVCGKESERALVTSQDAWWSSMYGRPLFSVDQQYLHAMMK